MDFFFDGGLVVEEDEAKAIFCILVGEVLGAEFFGEEDTGFFSVNEGLDFWVGAFFSCAFGGREEEVMGHTFDVHDETVCRVLLDGFLEEGI